MTTKKVAVRFQREHNAVGSARTYRIWWGTGSPSDVAYNSRQAALAAIRDVFDGQVDMSMTYRKDGDRNGVCCVGHAARRAADAPGEYVIELSWKAP